MNTRHMSCQLEALQQQLNDVLEGMCKVAQADLLGPWRRTDLSLFRRHQACCRRTEPRTL